MIPFAGDRQIHDPCKAAADNQGRAGKLFDFWETSFAFLRLIFPPAMCQRLPYTVLVGNMDVMHFACLKVLYMYACSHA